MGDKNEDIKKAFDGVKPQGKNTVELVRLYEDVKENPRMLDRYPLAVQFLAKYQEDNMIGGVEFEGFKEDLEYYFDADEEEEEEAVVDFCELREKLSVFDSRDKLERMWESLSLDEYFTDKCKEYFIKSILGEKD